MKNLLVVYVDQSDQCPMLSILKKSSNFIDFLRIYSGLRRPYHNFRCHLGKIVVSVVYVDHYDNPILRSGGLRRPDLVFYMKIS